MALTVGEANDVNTLLRWVLEEPDVMGEIPTAQQAGDAAARLAGRAHKTIMAGLTEQNVKAAWKFVELP